MKKWIHRALLLLGAAGVLSCEKAEPSPSPSLVVEGWIESGGCPVVQLSETVPVDFGRELGGAALMEGLVKWARVTVSDGEKDVVLTGVTDTRYFPPYIFTTDQIVGEVGRTYTLRVEYKDYRASARTTIPEPVPIEKLYLRDASDSLCTVAVGFIDPPGKGNCYKVFTKTPGTDSHYHPSATAIASDDNLDGYSEIALYSTQRLLDRAYWPNLRLGDELWVKLCTMDREAFRFWSALEDSISGVMVGNSRSYDGLNSMVEGASGYWIGYGVAEEKQLKLELPDS